MAVSIPGTQSAELVQRLRAAGCVFAEDEADVLLASADSADELDRMTSRRVAGEPLEQIVGWVDFCGLRIRLAPGVFVPRRRSVLVVREAVRLLNETIAATPPTEHPLVVLDLCCGSGAIGAAVAHDMRIDNGYAIELVSADVDAVAIDCTHTNVKPFEGQVFLGDMYGALPASFRGRIDLVVANAPYVPTDEVDLMPREAREHEPLRALDGGVDGVQMQGRVIAESLPWLGPRGQIIVETSVQQARGTTALFATSGFAASLVHSDETDSTVVIGHPNA